MQAVSDGTVPDIQGLRATPGQTGVLAKGRDGAARLYITNRYSAEQTSGGEPTNEDIVKGRGDIRQGGENKHGAECSVQLRRNQQRRNKYKPGFVMKTLICILMLIGLTFGAEVPRGWKETSLLAEEFDCSVPINLQTYSIPERCFLPPLETEETVELSPTPGFVLASEDIHAISGAVCSATVSRFLGYCEAYSHWKFMDVPEVEIAKDVSVEECRKAYTEHIFAAPDGKSLKVEPGDSVLYQFIEDRSITVHRYNTYCQGVILQLHHSQMAEESLVLTQIRFTLEKETFLRNKSGKMLAKISRRSVPDECWWKSGGCIDGSLAFIFNELMCPYKRVQPVQLQHEVENNLLLQLGFLFNVSETKKLTMEGCPGINLFYTTYEGVYLTMNIEAKELEVVRSLNIHESNSLGPTLEFFHYSNHKLVQSLIQKQKRRRL